MPAKVNTDTCIGCETCLSACKFEAITIQDGKAVVDPSKCTDCGECIKICPVTAIVME